MLAVVVFAGETGTLMTLALVGPERFAKRDDAIDREDRS
jgi:hypothetical protein